MSSDKFPLYPTIFSFSGHFRFFFRLSWLDPRFQGCLTLEIQGSSLWLQGFLRTCRKSGPAPAKCSRAEYLRNFFVAFHQQPEPNSASRAFFGPFLYLFFRWLFLSRHLKAPGSCASERGAFHRDTSGLRV